VTKTVTEIPGDKPGPQGEATGGDRKRFVEGLPSQLVNALTFVGFAVPVAGYFWLIHRYSLNVILADQWDDVVVINHSYSHLLDWSSLWAQHNENRIFFPNLVVLLLAHTTHFNIQVEEYLGALLLTGSIGLLIGSHKRRSPSTPWLYYCPVAIVMFSFVQYANTLWGFQLAWYLVLFAAAVALNALDRPVLTWWWLAVAIASAIVASYSSLQGLIVWPTGLLLLYYRRRTRSLTLVWISVAVLAAVSYFIDFVTPPAANDDLITHPIAGIEFFLVAVGDVMGVNVSGANATGIAVLLLGVVIVLTSICVLAVYCRGRDTASGTPIAAALICFGLLFAALVTEGRISGGWQGASQSRYRTFDLLIVVGLYLFVLEQFSLRPKTQAGSQSSAAPSKGPGGRVGATWSGRQFGPRGFAILTAVVAIIVCLQVGMGVREGLAGARAVHVGLVLTARVEANIDSYPNAFVTVTNGGVILPPASTIRKMDHVAQRHHLSLFSTGAAAAYKAEGLVPDPSAPSTSVTFPSNGAVMKGAEFLNATASDEFGITKVQFEVTGQGVTNTVVSRASPYAYGWLGAWHTTTVPNGLYTLESVAYNTAGHVAHSRAISVRIEN
jgi:hypothetical protein